MQIDFTNKRVLVTGGTRGIGRGAVETFLKAGARVAISGRTTESTAAAIAEFGDVERLVAAPGDVATAAGCEAVVEAAIQGLGGLDVLVNSAGFSKDGPVEMFDESLWDQVIDINLKGPFFCTRAALSALRESKGNIINLSSGSGLIGRSNKVAYCASKGGIVNMTRAMALEFAPDVRVNCVCPGWVDTDMMRQNIARSSDPVAREKEVMNAAPLKRVATPEEIATAIAYLASDDARFITGAAFAIDGGTTVGF